MIAIEFNVARQSLAANDAGKGLPAYMNAIEFNVARQSLAANDADKAAR